MYSINERKEDLGLLLGVENMHAALDRAISDVWVPFWRNLPRDRCTPRTLIGNPEIVFSMIEAVGSSLVTEKIALEREISAYREDMKFQRRVLLQTVADAAAFAASCEAFNVAYTTDNDLDDDSLDEPFDDHEMAADAPQDDDPTWKICVSFVGASKTKKMTHIVSHAEFVQFFANIASVVNYDPDPEVLGADLDGFFGPGSVLDQGSDGPTLR